MPADMFHSLSDNFDLLVALSQRMVRVHSISVWLQPTECTQLMTPADQSSRWPERLSADNGPSASADRQPLPQKTLSGIIMQKRNEPPAVPVV